MSSTTASGRDPPISRRPSAPPTTVALQLRGQTPSAAQAAAALPAQLPDGHPLHRAAARRSRSSASSSASVLLRLQPVADPAAGDDDRHPRHRADPGDPDRRHRPLGRRHHDPVLGGDGPVAVRYGLPVPIAFLLRLLCGALCGCDQRRRSSPICTCRPSSSRSAPGDLLAANFCTRPNETIRRRTSRPRRPSCSSSGPRSRSAARVLTYGSVLMVLLVAGALVHAQPHRLRPPRLRDRRRRRGGAPRRHQRQARCWSPSTARRPHLRASPAGS